MHLAVYAATGAGAVVHTHSAEVIALSASRDELPAVHYAITGLGGPVRVAAYTRFGSAGLAEAAVTALEARRAAILQNHGAICYGRDAARGLRSRAAAGVAGQGVPAGLRVRRSPGFCPQAELDEVSAEARRRQLRRTAAR